MFFTRGISNGISTLFKVLTISIALVGCKCNNGLNKKVEKPVSSVRYPSSDIFDIGVPFPKITPSARPVLGSSKFCGQIQEDFTNPLAKRRYWYVFGQLKHVIINGALKVKGSSSGWSGFGINTKNGKNGKPFNATGCQYLEFSLKGRITKKIKVEVTDFSGKTFVGWITSVPRTNRISIRLEGVSGMISKIQFLVGPGTTVNIEVDDISFTSDGATKRPVSSISDTDPLMKITRVNGRRTAGRYLQAINDLAGYFLNNSGDPPNATRITIIKGTKTRAAYHVYEDSAKHLCNGGATTSETQALFFNFMTLYGALTGKHEGAREALAYIRYFMMPHDGAGSPQLPDSRLGIGKNYPFLLHWAIDIYGRSKSRACPDGRPGTGVFGTNILYNMYDPTQNSPPYASLGRGKKHFAKFGSAIDAEQWLVNGAYWAGRYGLGSPAQFLLNLRSGLNEVMTPSDAKHYPNVTRFAVFWGEKNPPNISYRGSVNQLYVGYQNPAAWQIMGRSSWARNIVVFLEDAQKEFKKRYRYAGPFMPVFKDERWGWEGNDKNTDWMGFQYRAFAHLAHYYYLTGDKRAKRILETFTKWIKSKTRKDRDGEISIPLEIENKGAKCGKVRRSGYAPDFFALVAQGLIFMFARDKNQEHKKTAQTLLDFTVGKKSSNGSYFNPDPSPYHSGTVGFRNAEVGIALSLHELLLNN